jgi:NADH dehydrogenase/NADH:ubiquinone oxidoreductase subunit G
VLRLTPDKKDLSWEIAAEEIAARFKDGNISIVASGMLSNEDWSSLKTVFPAATLYFTAEPDQVGEEDALLRKKEKVPNLKGAENLGLKSGSFDALAKELESGKIKNLYVIDRDLAKVWGADRAKALVAKAGFSVFQGPNKGAVGDSYHYRLPATAYVEEEGHFTNFEGKVQAYKKALDPIGDARPDWAIFDLLHKAMSGVPA